MQHAVREKLESAALRLDDYLDSAAPGPRDNILIAAAREIAQALEMLQDA